MTTSDSPNPAQRLNELLAVAGEPELNPDLAGRFESYLALLLRWNARLNLTAVQDQEGILSRHFVESIMCARAIPKECRTLLDFGSGAGFPGIPIALCRPELSVTLAESQKKKAAFLREAVRTLGLKTFVHSARAEALETSFDCVALRAVDGMENAVTAGSRLVASAGWLALMTTRRDLPELQRTAGPVFEWSRTVNLPESRDRVIALGFRRVGIVPRGTNTV